MTPATPQWWRTAVVYEVYLRSFADASGDGVGDIAGLLSRLPYLADLGVDAVWVTPWYPSPMADGGYDVCDHRDIDPLFGTLEEAEQLIHEAHRLGLRIIVDLVANHTSDQHPWFQGALAAGPRAPERDRYFFREGQQDGAAPPNDWISAFGGPAWTRIHEPDGRPGQWYLHTFAPQQPDLNWEHPDVREDIDDVLRFWLDRGVDGIRVDAAPAMAKRPGLPPAGHAPDAVFDPTRWTASPHWDVEEVHDILRRWRALVEGYGGDRVLVAEAIVSGPDRLSRYLRPDEVHTAFNFDYLKAPWQAAALRSVIDATLAALEPVAAPATWVLSSHDETRHVTRFGRPETSGALTGLKREVPVDLDLGRRRARAAALLLLALPGGVCLYQGEELGLPEVEDLPVEALQDPTWERSGRTHRGRDGCRVPLPWSGAHPPFGFSADGVAPWLPQPQQWAALTVETQIADPCSMLALYRTALRLRRELRPLQEAGLTWKSTDPDVLVLDRGDDFRCVVNVSAVAVPLAGHGRLLLSSDPGTETLLPPDTAAWLRRPSPARP